jgi:hypothetical protein
MVLAFDSTGKFGEAVFGSTSSQHAGTNGAIASSNPSATAPVAMKGGRRRSQRQSRNKQRRNKQSRKRQRAGQTQNQNQNQNQNQGGQNQNQNQGGQNQNQNQGGQNQNQEENQTGKMAGRRRGDRGFQSYFRKRPLPCPSARQNELLLRPGCRGLRGGDLLETCGALHDGAGLRDIASHVLAANGTGIFKFTHGSGGNIPQSHTDSNTVF